MIEIMGIKILVVSRNIAMWDYSDINKVCTYEYIGYIDDALLWERNRLKPKNVIQFYYIGIGFFSVFNIKQVRVLKEEIKILDGLNIVHKTVLDMIKDGIEKALQNNSLYLKFEDD